MMNAQQAKEYNVADPTTLPVADLVGELLTISLSRYDIEVIIDASSFFYSSKEGIETTGLLKTTIDAEDMNVSEEQLEITLSGTVLNQLGRKEAFTLFFSMLLDKSKNNLRYKKNIFNVESNTLYIRFSKKAEQLNDSVFQLTMYRPMSETGPHTYGEGKGFLVFGREESGRPN